MRINKSDFVKAKVHHSVTPEEALKMLRKLQGKVKLRKNYDYKALRIEKNK